MAEAPAKAEGTEPVYRRRDFTYDRWMESVGIPIHRGYYVEDLRTVELGRWEERGCNAAFADRSSPPRFRRSQGFGSARCDLGRRWAWPTRAGSSKDRHPPRSPPPIDQNAPSRPTEAPFRTEEQSPGAPERRRGASGSHNKCEPHTAAATWRR